MSLSSNLSHKALLSLPRLSLSLYLSLSLPYFSSDLSRSFNSIHIYPYHLTIITKVASLECSGPARGNGCCHALHFMSSPYQPRPAPPWLPSQPPQARGATAGPASQPISAPGQLKHYPCCVDTSVHRVACLFVCAWSCVAIFAVMR